VLEPTPSQTVGPFFSFGLCSDEKAALVPADAPEAIRITGRVLDGEGEGVPDAMVEIWQADAEGRYRSDFGWGRSGCDGEGGYSLVTCKPGRVSDGNGGLQAPHLSVLVFARGLLKPVHTRLYFPGDEANADDRVLAAVPDGERSTLVARAVEGGLEFDVRLRGEGQTTFFAV
jgi:protocatechuate 3,4-dioxygenase alpha subunit